MKLITRSELAGKNSNELSAMFTKVTRTLACTQPNTPERRNALASLETINKAQALKM